jgi:Uma2 family endonuclease
MPPHVPQRYADAVSAEPTPDAFELWRPDPDRQQRADYTVEDVVNLPDDAPRVELLDGVMNVVPTPSDNHQDIASLLHNWLRRHTPPGLKASLMVGVGVGLQNSFEPDVLIRRSGPSPERHLFTPEDVILVAEVVSPGTRRRDRFIKPAGYAAARIRHYWRIEQHPVHVYAYELGEDGHYALVADSAELIELDRPFSIKLAVAEIAP